MPRFHVSAFVAAVLFVTPTGLLAQSIADGAPRSDRNHQESRGLRPPVRLPPERRAGSETGLPGDFVRVQYVEPLDQGAAIGVHAESSGSPHQIIRAPRMAYGDGSGEPHHRSAPQRPPLRGTSNPVHAVPDLIHYQYTPTRPATIPDASPREVWKSPYAYGYFGAAGTRHWIRHYGYRDRDIEWRLR